MCVGFLPHPQRLMLLPPDGDKIPDMAETEGLCFPCQKGLALCFFLGSDRSLPCSHAGTRTQMSAFWYVCSTLKPYQALRPASCRGSPALPACPWSFSWGSDGAKGKGAVNGEDVQCAWVPDSNPNHPDSPQWTVKNPLKFYLFSSYPLRWQLPHPLCCDQGETVLVFCLCGIQFTCLSGASQNIPWP